MFVSIVIPVYNGARTIGPLVRHLLDVLHQYTLQIVLVNDDSPDNSDAVCRALYEEHPESVTYLKLAKNFGEHNAVMAGLRHTRGDYVVIMDDDFQNPPDEVARLIDCAAHGDHDVVYTWYRRKHHHWFRNLGSRLNNFVASWMLDKPRDLYLSSFKCLSRFAVPVAGGTAFPGEGLMRISCDFAAGSAGVASFLHRLKTGAAAPFMLDEIFEAAR